MKRRYTDRIKKNVLALAHRRRLTMEQLAIETDIAKSYFSHIFAGRRLPSLEMLGRVADALGVDVVDLLKP